MRKLPVIILLVLTATSCFEEDIMVPPHQQGNLEIGKVQLGYDYDRQVFYDLNSNREVSSNVISDWDLVFESSEGGWTIRLNSSKYMYAGNSYDTIFSSELSRSDLEMKFDRSDGDPDSTAIGTWFELEGDSIRSLEHVYLVDRGRDEFLEKIGFEKVQFKITDSHYLVRHANPDNTGEINTMISRKEDADRRIYYSFDNGIVEIAPGPSEWSLLYSKYTTMLVTDAGEDYPYLVTGVLLNPDGVTAARDTIHDFLSIQLADTIDLDLTSRSDVIGYDWKYYNSDGIYTIESDRAYVIRDRNGFYYKLRFIDFYNDTGEKGHPQFEFVKL